ncbi:MAG: DUF971 family protein [Oceanicoccus sp.]|jgi:DUF971 family protein
MYSSLAIPTDIQLQKESSILNITWSDKGVSQITGRQLRQYCACASCRARKVVGVQLVSDSSTIERLDVFGSSGLQVIFTDGHDRGVYPWRYLRAIADGRADELVNTRLHQ